MKWLEFSDYTEVILPFIGLNLFLLFLDMNIGIRILIIMASILLIFSALKFRNWQYEREIKMEAKMERRKEEYKNRILK